MNQTAGGGRGALPSDLKRINRRKILEYFRKGETLTAADVPRMSGVSRPTVMRALQYFCRICALDEIDTLVSDIPLSAPYDLSNAPETATK